MTVHTEKLNTSPHWGTSGKTDSYIVPQYKGNYPVKPMQFSYFDLNLGKYKTISYRGYGNVLVSN
jgi:hypothetical protein